MAESTHFGTGHGLGEKISMCTQRCIVAESMGDANTRLTAKPGQPCRILGRSMDQESREGLGRQGDQSLQQSL